MQGRDGEEWEEEGGRNGIGSDHTVTQVVSLSSFLQAESVVARDRVISRRAFCR
jgi:hypothetical protein